MNFDLFTILPILSLSLFVAGCISIPVVQGPGSDRNHWEGVVGNSDSSAPIQIGKSDRASVIAALGKPTWVDGISTALEDPPHSGGDFWEFRHLQLTGYTIHLIPMRCDPLVENKYSRDDFLAIWFDESGMVRKFAAWNYAQSIVPPDVLAQEKKYNSTSTRP